MPSPRPSPPFTEIRVRLESGERNRDLAREYGVSNQLISYWAKRAGYVSPGRRVPNLERNGAAVAALLRGEPAKRAAYRLGMTENALRAIAYRSGVSLTALRYQPMAAHEVSL